jgi:hypothetical protein
MYILVYIWTYFIYQKNVRNTTAESQKEAKKYEWIGRLGPFGAKSEITREVISSTAD